MSKVFKLGSLFCGAGGLDCGILEATDYHRRLQVVPEWATDNDRDACKTYKYNLAPESQVICTDVKNLKIDELSEVSAFAYGFPCNSFRIANGRTCTIIKDYYNCYTK